MKALVTLALGDSPFFAATHPLMERYTARVGATFVPIRGPYPDKLARLRKLEIFGLLERFDRILYLDGDVVVRPDAPCRKYCFLVALRIFRCL